MSDTLTCSAGTLTEDKIAEIWMSVANGFGHDDPEVRERVHRNDCAALLNHIGALASREAELVAALREAGGTLYEVETNGEWTLGEQAGDWRISKQVYEMVREAVSRIDALAGGGR